MATIAELDLIFRTEAAVAEGRKFEDSLDRIDKKAERATRGLNQVNESLALTKRRFREASEEAEKLRRATPERFPGTAVPAPPLPTAAFATAPLRRGVPTAIPALAGAAAGTAATGVGALGLTPTNAFAVALRSLTTAATEAAAALQRVALSAAVPGRRFGPGTVAAAGVGVEAGERVAAAAARSRGVGSRIGRTGSPALTGASGTDILAGGRAAIGGVLGLPFGSFAAAGVGLAAGAGIATAIGEANQQAIQFEETFAKIVGLTSEVAGNVERLQEGVLDIAVETGRGPNELAEALYFVESAGFAGAAALDVLRTSALAATAGLGETTAIAQTLTSVITTYGAANIDAGEAADVLVAAVREGKAEAGSFAGVLGRILPVAQSLGISFADTAAGIAALTRGGLSADESVTALRNTMSALLDPTPQAAEALEAVGLNAEEVRRTIAEEGLIEALLGIDTALQGNIQQLAQVFPELRGLVAVLSLVGENADAVRQIFDNLRNSTGNLGSAVEASAGTIKKQMEEAAARLDRAAIALGNLTAPIKLRSIEFLAVGIERMVAGVKTLTEEDVGLWERLSLTFLARFAGDPTADFLAGLIRSNVEAEKLENRLKQYPRYLSGAEIDAALLNPAEIISDDIQALERLGTIKLSQLTEEFERASAAVRTGLSQQQADAETLRRRIAEREKTGTSGLTGAEIADRAGAIETDRRNLQQLESDIAEGEQRLALFSAAGARTAAVYEQLKKGARNAAEGVVALTDAQLKANAALRDFIFQSDLAQNRRRAELIDARAEAEGGFGGQAARAEAASAFVESTRKIAESEGTAVDKALAFAEANDELVKSLRAIVEAEGSESLARINDLLDQGRTPAQAYADEMRLLDAELARLPENARKSDEEIAKLRGQIRAATLGTVDTVAAMSDFNNALDLVATGLNDVLTPTERADLAIAQLNAALETLARQNIKLDPSTIEALRRNAEDAARGIESFDSQVRTTTETSVRNFSEGVSDAVVDGITGAQDWGDAFEQAGARAAAAILDVIAQLLVLNATASAINALTGSKRGSELLGVGGLGDLFSTGPRANQQASREALAGASTPIPTGRATEEEFQGYLERIGAGAAAPAGAGLSGTLGQIEAAFERGGERMLEAIEQGSDFVVEAGGEVLDFLREGGGFLRSAGVEIGTLISNAGGDLLDAGVQVAQILIKALSTSGTAALGFLGLAGGGSVAQAGDGARLGSLAVTARRLALPREEIERLEREARLPVVSTATGRAPVASALGLEPPPNTAAIALPPSDGIGPSLTALVGEAGPERLLHTSQIASIVEAAHGDPRRAAALAKSLGEPLVRPEVRDLSVGDLVIPDRKLLGFFEGVVGKTPSVALGEGGAVVRLPALQGGGEVLPGSPRATTRASGQDGDGGVQVNFHLTNLGQPLTLQNVRTQRSQNGRVIDVFGEAAANDLRQGGTMSRELEQRGVFPPVRQT